MIGTKYLGQYMEGVELGSNTFIIAPVGSGKTHYIFEDLCKTAKTLYLVDTDNLRKGTLLNHYNTTDKRNIDHTFFMNVIVDTYAGFGRSVEKNAEHYISQFDYIICDEIHNLIGYEKKFTENPAYTLACQALMDKYSNTKIVWITATPQYINWTTNKFKHFTDNFKIYDFTDFKKYPDIRRYENRSICYMSHYTDAKTYLTRYLSAFNNFGEKCLMYTNQIDVMLKFESMCIDLGLKPICIWSENATEKMSIPQRTVKEHLLQTGYLMEPYNVLIINGATETGVNIYDPKMKMMVCNSTSEVQQTQSRGRIRQDIDLLVIKTNNKELLEFSIDDEILGLWLTKESIIERIVVKNNLRNEYGRQLGIKALPNILTKYGYKMESKKVRDKEHYAKTGKSKNITKYQITKL